MGLCVSCVCASVSSLVKVNCLLHLAVLLGELNKVIMENTHCLAALLTVPFTTTTPCLALCPYYRFFYGAFQPGSIVGS